ncbi:hypothetical protein KKC45_01035 [Patescibacteria group bacterium]|nr:hypothetical protein [Patescibacteria group bacterium]
MKIFIFRVLVVMSFFVVAYGVSGNDEYKFAELHSSYAIQKTREARKIPEENPLPAEEEDSTSPLPLMEIGWKDGGKNIL